MELHYLLREPQKITNETPVLFLLHGYGSNEEDLFSFVPNLPENWLVVSFRAPYNTQFGGYCWYDINFDNSEKFIDTQQANQSLNLILSTILEISNKFGLTHNPNHLCGFSQGGILSYALALSVPDIFRKIACLSCYPEEKILNKIIKDKKKIEKMSFFISHGTEDSVIPIEWGRKGADILYDLGALFTFREYMSGHSINQKNYMDLMEFFRN